MATQFKTETDWVPAPERLTVRDGEVHLWRSRLIMPTAPRAGHSFTASEWLRASQLHARGDRARFLAMRTALRNVLGHYLCPLFDALPAGHRGDIGGLHFDLSASGGCALIAITMDGAVGVDVEHVRHDVPVDDLAEYFFEPREVWDVRIQRGEEKALRFFELWTGKEALSKAADRHRAPQSLALRQIVPAEGYAGALALGGDCQLACFDSLSS